MKRIIILIAPLVLSQNLSGQSFSYLNSETRLEERFVYNVSWTFIHIGTITMTVERIISYPDLRKITLEIKTAPALPFVNIDEYNVAVMRITDGMTMYFHGIEKQNDMDFLSQYYEDRNYCVYSEKNTKTGEQIKLDTLGISQPFLVGTSLIQYARIIADSGLEKKIPTLLGGIFYPTIIDYSGPAEFIDVDAYDKPISSFRYEGSAEWNGKATAGLSGEYTGWLSNDKSKVVLRAKMKIFIGSINIELEKWFKPGWIPPSNSDYFAGNKK